MGIEGFLKRVRDAGFGDRKVLGHAGAPLHTKAVIDGPSLAHYIYSKLGDKETVDSSIAPKVTYSAIAASAIEWLDELQTYGLHIEAIFFDGALPASKKSTRVQRLTKYTQNLIAYQQTYNDQHRQITQGQLPVKYWDNSRVNKARRERAPPAFLVAAVVDALLESHYTDVSYVVPDEADRYCVAAARQICSNESSMGVTVFTNDSDLIVFEVGPRTAIVIFNDLDEKPSCRENKALSGIEFRPQEMMNKHHLSSLLEVAFLMKASRATSFAEAARSQDAASSRPGFDDFSREYQMNHLHRDYQIALTNRDQRTLAKGLDARISELVLQINTQDGTQPPKEADMYLPFLLEDPSKSTAWRIGTFWRAMAYGILLSTYGSTRTSIKEYKRHASRVVGTEVDLPDSAKLDSTVTATQQWLKSSMVEVGSLTSTERWRFIVMRLTVQDLEQQEIAINTTTDIMTVLAGRPTSRWEVIHLSARYQAMFYSMRICCQVLRYILGTKPALKDSMPSSDSLLHTLSALPSVSEFFDPVFDIMKAVYAAEWNAVLEKYRAIYARHYTKEETEDVESMETEVKETTSSDVSSEDEGNGGSLAGNPFAALAQS